MNWINQLSIVLCTIVFGLTNLSADSLELTFDHTTQAICDTQNSSPSCHSLTIENTGDHPIDHVLPYVNTQSYATIEGLKADLEKEKYPLLALYKRWEKSLIKDDSFLTDSCHPLDLLNFIGRCSKEVFKKGFIRLCHLLGIDIRQASIHGDLFYDFFVSDDWSFLDVNQQQFYLNLDNQTLVSSEEVMDDPFLALRTKHHRLSKQVDFKKGWQQLARFEIAEPTAPEPVPMIQEVPLSSMHPQAFELYPSETLFFCSSSVCSDLQTHQRRVEHVIELEQRKVGLSWNYGSPFPLHKIENKSSATLQLVDQKVSLEPGQSYLFDHQDTFCINVRFGEQPQGKLVITGTFSWALFPVLTQGQNNLCLGGEENPTTIQWLFDVEEVRKEQKRSPLQILNTTDEFDHCSPYFILGSTSLEPIEEIGWQISSTSDFQLIPSNFDQVEPFTSTLTVPLISETFLNANETYYFRAKAKHEGEWGDWSVPYSFIVRKPLPVEEAEFDKIGEGCYEISWGRFIQESDPSIEYLIFGSNSLDFIPSIYCDKQVNATMNGKVTEEETNDNLIAMTQETRLQVTGELAYYRIIARQKGQLSVPSSLVHVYDTYLFQPRNVLQVVKEDNNNATKRVLIPSSYSWSGTALPSIDIPSIPVYEEQINHLSFLLREAISLSTTRPHYELHSSVTNEAWQAVRPYLLPENHPAKPKLDRLFSKKRISLNPGTLQRAGFPRWQPGRYSRVTASSHPELKDYFLKIYCDNEVGIKYDWKRWVQRCEGAEMIRDCIHRHHYQKIYSVPDKWIYPLPPQPSPPNEARYLRKNFVLVTDNMNVLPHKENKKAYRTKMDRNRLDALYTIFQECGLYDSVYPFNCPFCKDGKIAIIDTEYHHKWPVPFYKLRDHFAKELRSYWERITFRGGAIPDGVTRPHLPRQDRRDP